MNFDGNDSEPSASKNRRKDVGHNFDSCQMQIDNSENILKTMKSLYSNHLMCDVYLTVGDKIHAAHKLILSASSDVFQVTFIFKICSDMILITIPSFYDRQC